MRSKTYNRILLMTLVHALVALVLFAPLLAMAQTGTGVNQAGSQSGVGDKLALGTAGRWIGTAIVGIAMIFTYIGGMLLDMSVLYLVLGMGEMIRNGAIEQAINNTWTVVRDVANLAFIFGFVYIGIRTIYDYENASTKRALASLVIAALLINFSLFFTKVVIDVSNILAVEIYTTLIAPTAQAGAAERGISQVFSQSMGLVTWQSLADPATLGNLTAGGTFTFYFAMALFLVIAGFIFAAGGILFIIRFVVLVLIMVFSPFLFAATVLPKAQGYASMLWSYLINYSFFAPAYLFLIYVSLQLIRGSSMIINPNSGSLGSAFEVTSNTPKVPIDSFGVILNFTIITIFLVASLIIARQLGIVGANQAIKIGHTMRLQGQRYLGSSTAGLMAATGRSTIGRYGAKRIDDGEWKEKKSRSWFGRQQIKFADRASQASFDARQVGGWGKELNIGEGKKGGYAGRVKEKQKNEEAFAKLLGQVSDDDIRVKAREKEVKDIERQIRETREERNRADDVNEKKRLANKIADLQGDLQKAQDRVEQEKNRRIIGSTYAPKDVEEKIKHGNDRVKVEEDKIKAAVEGYINAASDAERQAFEQSATAARKTIEKIREEQMNIRRDAGVNTGYADEVEQRGWIASTFGGRNKGINRKVGKELRKKHSKKIRGSSGSSGGNRDGGNGGESSEPAS